MLDRFISQRNEAFRTLDIEWARGNTPLDCDDATLLVALHKARYECVGIEPALRHESGEWLRQRGYTRMYGLPFTDELPT